MISWLCEMGLGLALLAVTAWVLWPTGPDDFGDY